MGNQKNIEKSEVVRDAEGLPLAWRLFAIGENLLTDQQGDGLLRMNKADIDTILERFNTKGLDIPIDGDHYLEHLAKDNGVDADELAKSAPYKEGEGTLGFGKLEKRADGLWITVQKWHEAAKTLIKEGQYRYFSPYVKGLDGKTPLRVTSVALTNSPKLNSISEIGCSELKPHQQPKEAQMEDPDKKDKDKPCAEGENASATVEEQLAALQEENAALKAENEALKKQLEDEGEEVGLSEKDPAKRRGALRAIGAKVKDAPTIASRLAELELAEKNRKIDTVIAKGVAEGKIATAEIPALRQLGEVGLAEYLRVATPRVPLEKLGVTHAPAAEIALSEEEREMGKKYGLTDEQMLASKKKLQQ